MDVWYSFAKSIVRGYLTLFVDKINVSGGSLLPGGPKIIVANHTNVTDAFVLPFLTKEKIHFLIQAETFTLPVIGRLLTLADQIPVYLGQGRDALDLAREKLSLGHSVAIFPEGRLNDGRSFHRAGAGAALLALESGAPIVPVGFFVPDKYARPIKGHFHQRDTFGRWQFGGQCFVRIGDPWQLTASFQEKVNYRELRKTTEKMMNRVAELVSLAQDEARRLGVMA
jgi:1-acyl-sn-glycerol-3-phosphate acyltransferase